MTLLKRSFLQFVSLPLIALALAACGGNNDDTVTATAAGTGGSGASTGSLVITGTSNLPDAATAITPNAGLPATTPPASTATVDVNLLDGAVHGLVNNVLRVLSVPLAGTAPPAVGSSYAVVTDGTTSGSVLTLLASEVLTGKNYFFFSESGTVKITALSATSVTLVFTNVTLAADSRANNNAATGKVILNGTVTLTRV